MSAALEGYRTGQKPRAGTSRWARPYVLGGAGADVLLGAVAWFAYKIVFPAQLPATQVSENSNLRAAALSWRNLYAEKYIFRSIGEYSDC
jgi:hypothetical protein